MQILTSFGSWWSGLSTQAKVIAVLSAIICLLLIFLTLMYAFSPAEAVVVTGGGAAVLEGVRRRAASLAKAEQQAREAQASSRAGADAADKGLQVVSAERDQASRDSADTIRDDANRLL